MHVRQKTTCAAFKPDNNTILRYHAGMIPESLPFHIDAHGWLQPAVHKPSPNFNQRPLNTGIDLLVIHNISLPPGEFGGDFIAQLFCNTLDCSAHPALHDLHGVQVSSHLLIDRAGLVTQFVSFDDRAWHAGVSQFHGRDNCNNFSIGIELEGTDTCPYTTEQYYRLAQIARLLMIHYPAITPAHIVGHSAIAPGRKTDPGESFDWSFFHSLLT
jgi:AmpD protein